MDLHIGAIYAMHDSCREAIRLRDTIRLHIYATAWLIYCQVTRISKIQR